MNGGGLIEFAWVAFLEIIIASVMLVFVFIKVNTGRASWVVLQSKACHLLKKSWPLILSSLAITLYMKIDQIMLGQLASESEIGIFSAALRISEVWYFLPMMIVPTFYPALLRSERLADGLFDRDMLRLLRGLVTLALVITLPIWIFSDKIIYLLYGNAFKGAAPVLAIHVWTSVFVFLEVAGGRWYIIKGLERLTFVRTLTAACANVLLNLKLIPYWGAVGAAMASLAAQMLSGFLFNAATRHTRPLFYLQCRSIISCLKI